MLSKRELLTRIKGKKVDIDISSKGGVIEILAPRNPNFHYFVITEVGEDVFEATSYVKGSLSFKEYFSIDKIIVIYSI